MKNLKKISNALFLTLAAAAITFTSCDKNDGDNNKNVLKFNPAKVEVTTGKTASVTVSGGIAPYTVASRDTKIATVKADNSTITITGVGKGTTTISVTDNDKKNSGAIFVTVKDAAGLEFDHINLRESVQSGDIMYLEYCYFFTYLLLLLITVTSFRIGSGGSIDKFLKATDTILIRYFWTIILGLMAIATIVKFY